MNTLTKFVRVLVCLLMISFIEFVPFQSFGQNPYKQFKQGWSINLNGGVNLFYGDINNYRFYKSFENNSEWRFAYGFIVQKKLSPLFGLRGQFLNGELSGTRRVNNKWFEADIMETSLSATLDFTNLFWGYKKRLFSVYGMLGVGLAHWTTDLMVFPTNELISGNGHNTGSGLFGRTMETVIPFGLGADFRINDNWSINIEGTLRPVTSDALDAKIAEYEYDFYSYNFVGVTYSFVKREKKKPAEKPQPLIAEEVVEPVVEEKVEDEFPDETPIHEQKLYVKEEEEKVDPQVELDKKLLVAESRTGLYESPWPGVNFTVQIAASRSQMPTEKFAEKYSVPGTINVNQGEDGWYRYSIGDYLKYWKAREYKNILVTRNQINDAFVVAYKDGQRITLKQLVYKNYTDDATMHIKEKPRPVVDRAFAVQILASRDGELSSRVFKEMYEIEQEVFKEFSNGWYQYTVGNYDSYQQAAKLRNKLKARGVTDAFVVGYKNGKRVEVSTIAN